MNFFDQFNGRRHLISAHRGWRAIRPENTLCAFEAAIGHCDFIETDIQLSHDGIPLLLHDHSLQRTSDVALHPAFTGRAPWPVEAFDLDELLQLDLGSWFIADDPFGTLASGELQAATLAPLLPQRLPTLDQLLQLAVAEQVPLNLELKDLTGEPATDSPVAPVINAIMRYQAAPLILISSTNHDYLQQCSRLAPEVPIAALQQDHGHQDNLIDTLQQLGVSAYHCDWRDTDASLISQMNSAGLRCGVYTVNERKLIDQLFDQGAYAVFTDRL